MFFIISFSFRERNATKILLGQNQSLLVFEACNFASNLAYYQLVVALASYPGWSLPRPVLQGLAQTSAGLALGSAFYHGSHTSLGGQADTVLIRLMAFIMHQASLDGLPGRMKTPVLMDLEMKSRNMTGVAMSQVVTDMFRMENTSR